MGMTLSAPHIAKFDTAVNLLKEIVSDRQTHFEEKSEKWQESDAGQDYQSETEELDDFVNQLEGMQN